jgi:hypothetical protein
VRGLQYAEGTLPGRPMTAEGWISPHARRSSTAVFHGGDALTPCMGLRDLQTPGGVFISFLFRSLLYGRGVSFPLSLRCLRFVCETGAWPSEAVRASIFSERRSDETLGDPRTGYFSPCGRFSYLFPIPLRYGPSFCFAYAPSFYFALPSLHSADAF